MDGRPGLVDCRGTVVLAAFAIALSLFSGSNLMMPERLYGRSTSWINAQQSGELDFGKLIMPLQFSSSGKLGKNVASVFCSGNQKRRSAKFAIGKSTLFLTINCLGAFSFPEYKQIVVSRQHFKDSTNTSVEGLSATQEELEDLPQRESYVVVLERFTTTMFSGLNSTGLIFAYAFRSTRELQRPECA